MRFGALTVLLVLVAGCGGGTPLAIEDIDDTAVEERVRELSLGYYVVPVPMPFSGEMVQLATRNRMQFEFDLYAEILNEHHSRAEAAAQRNEGRLRDNVITVCRSTPMDDLNDQTLTALKSHLIDTTVPLLDGVPIEQLRIVDRQTKPL